MKFLVVFVTLAAVAFGYPATTTWTLNELSEALQNPTTDPVLVPYLEAALNHMMSSLYQSQQVESITIAMPVVAEYTLQELAAALQNPNTNPAYIPYLEDALNKLMAAFYAGENKPTITVALPSEEKPTDVPGFVDLWPVLTPETEPEFVDLWPVQKPETEPGFVDLWPVQQPETEPGFVDLWPVQTPEVAAPVVPAPVAPAASSPLVQIIVNVQKQQVSDVTSPVAVIERPTLEPVVNPVARS